MASSLQKQLAAIAANSTHELDVKAQRTAYSKSLLFEPKQATAQTYETIYQIGLQGLRDLCAIDPRFHDFRDTIFSQHSLSHDRAQLLPAQAQDLDRVIEKFLGLVGSRLLLRPAIKALEWLVRRYRIHEHNTDFLILTFLPYHTAPVFKTLLSILPAQLSPHLRFLHPYVASLANPPRTALVQTAVHDKNFFSAFNHYVLDRAAAHHQYTGLLTLWAAVVVQSIEFRLQSSQSGRQNVEAQKQQDLLTQFLPILERALSIPKVPELALGAYMIILVLSGKLDLEEHVLDAFILAITRNWTLETLDAALGCIAAVSERKHSTRLPRRTVQSILRVDDLAVKLGSLSQHQSVEQLALGLLSGAIESQSTNKPVELESNGVLASVVQTVRLGQRSIQRLTRLIELAPAEKSIAAFLELRRALTAAVEIEQQTDALPSADEDVAMEDIEQNQPALVPVNHVQLDSLLEKVPATVGQGSFLCAANNSVFETLASAFQVAHQEAEATAKCLAVPALEGNNLARLSFLVRVAISDSHASVRRKAALALGQLLLEKSKAEPACDYQNLAPYAMVLLMDQDLKVRRSAAKLISLIQTAIRACMDNSEHAQWDQQDMFSVESQRISVKLASSFLERTVVACAEECIVDCTYLARVVQNNLDDIAAHSNKNSKRLKGEERKLIFTWLSFHAQHTASFGAKKRLLDLLNKVNKAGGLYRSKYLLALVLDWSAQDSAGAAAMANEPSVALDAVDKAVVETIHPSDGEALEQLSTVAKSTSRDALSRAAFARMASLWPLAKLEGQLALARFLLEVQLSSALSDRASAAHETLSSVQISAEAYTVLIQEPLGGLEATEPASKRRRTSDKHDPQLQMQQDASLAQLTAVLELQEGSESLADLELFYTLFRALQALQDIKARQGSNISYATELTLSILSSMAKGVDKITAGQQLDSSIVRTDLLVDCVRASSNAHVRNSAMLLLAHLAKKVPQKVLHTVMPIFTLMSSSSATQGDEFTIHVVDQTIQQVVPLMADSLRSQDKDVVSATAEIILSFASAFEHIPSARRLHLFTLLVNALGAEDALFAILAALKDHAPDNLELGRFSVRLMQQFSAAVCMTTVVKYLGLCLDYFTPAKSLYKVFVKSDVASTDPAEGLARLLALLALILKDGSFQARIRTSADGDQVRASFTKSLEHTIKLSQLSVDETRVNAACPKVLEGLLSLLPFPEFIQAAQPLLESTDSDLCRSVVRALEFQVRSSVKLDTEAKEAALDCIPRLVRILQSSTNLPLQHSTIACLDRICDRFGKIGQQATLEAAQAVSSKGCIMGDDDTLRTLSLHCLATTIEVLGNEFIPLLQKSIEAASNSLDRSIQLREVNLHSAAYAVLIALVEHVPFVISARAIQHVFRLTQASVQARLGRDADETRHHFLQIAATKLDMQVICAVSLLVWDSAIASGYSSVQELVGLVASAIDHRGKSAVGKSVRDLFKFFLQALDVRTGVAAHKGSYEESQTAELEHGVINALLALIFKINDTTFRPFFGQLFEWTVEGGDRELRSLTFFSFLLRLSEKLKSLVTGYFGVVVERAAEILDTARPDAGQQALRVAVLKALRSSFTNDEADFWASPSRFQVIMAPLLAQLPALSLQMATSEVVPTVTELASCANSQDNLKEINWQLLAQFRSESAKTRLAAVRCQHSLTDSLGEDWLGLLPEMLPLISELQEDDDERVERETHKWIKAIEGELGESLDAMLQ